MLKLIIIKCSQLEKAIPQNGSTELHLHHSHRCLQPALYHCTFLHIFRCKGPLSMIVQKVDGVLQVLRGLSRLQTGR